MRYFSQFYPNYIITLVYMLQRSEYRTLEYLKWYWRVSDFRSVMYRDKLVFTTKAMLMVGVAAGIKIIQHALSIWLVYLGITEERVDYASIGVGLILVEPLITSHLLVLPLLIGEELYQKPRTRAMVNRAHQTFVDHPGKTIAVLGSYGKTTTKEVIATVLSEKLEVAASGGNFNTPIGLSRFAGTLTGKEDVVVVELGEFEPGDIVRYCELVRPDMAVITGLSEAHLETLGSLEAAAANLLEVANYVSEEDLFVNTESEKMVKRLGDTKHQPFNQKSVGKWKITEVKTSLEGTSFQMKKGNSKIKAKSKIMGKHMVPTLALAAEIAKKFGLKNPQIEAGLAKTKPFKHRFQLAQKGDVTIIDDTYNGNIEGVKAGVEFVKGIKANRKIYITPGLVEMADQREAIHNELGRLVAPVFDEVVVMKNSNSDYIVDGLMSGGFTGEFKVIDDPVSFYQNLDGFTAAGDVVLMQNDLPDNYF